MDHRTCVNRFECRRCADFARLNHPATAQQDKVCGLSFPANRLYHRGHTWVEPQPDGALLVGLDEIGSRIMGKPDEVELPAAGTRVSAHGSGWSMKKAGYGVRVLAPVSGEVVETGGPEAGYYLRIKPDTQNPDLRHLLRGAEVQGWVMRELEALQAAFVPAGSAVSLADGGELMNDIISNIPTAAWDTVLGQLFLEP